MRWLEDINIDDPENPIRGKEFWIVGSGPSLDDYPDDFFEGKIAIGLNNVFVAFPNLTFYCTGDVGLLPGFMVKTNPELIKRTIWALSLELTLGKYKDHPRVPAPFTSPGWDEYKDDLIYITRKVDTQGVADWFKDELYLIIDDIMKRKVPCHFVALRTVAHFAVLCAIYLGAQKVTMVGCEAKYTKHAHYAQKRGLHESTEIIAPNLSKKDGTPEIVYSVEGQEGRTPYLTCFRVGAEIMADVFAPHGVEIRKYYYGKGYEVLTGKQTCQEK